MSPLLEAECWSGSPPSPPPPQEGGDPPATSRDSRPQVSVQTRHPGSPLARIRSIRPRRYIARLSQSRSVTSSIPRASCLRFMPPKARPRGLEDVTDLEWERRAVYRLGRIERRRATGCHRLVELHFPLGWAPPPPSPFERTSTNTWEWQYRAFGKQEMHTRMSACTQITFRLNSRAGEGKLHGRVGL